MDSPRTSHEEWLRLKLDELDEVERKMDAVRPASRLRERILMLFLLAVVVGTGVTVSTDPRLAGTSIFGLAAFVALVTTVAIVTPHHRLKVLEWRREELLAQIGSPRSGASDG